MEKTAKRTNYWLLRLTAILIACVVLLVGVALLYPANSADAAVEKGPQTITVSNATVNRGMEFDVDISIGNNSTGIQALRLFVTFDPSAMTLIGVTPLNPVSNESWVGGFKAANKDANNTYDSYGVKQFVLVWVDEFTDNWKGEGTIARLRFASKSSAQAKPYNVNVTVDPTNTLVWEDQKCTLDVTGGTITMIPGVYSIYLYNATGGEYASEESNKEEGITIEEVLQSRNGLPPTKESTSKYTYTFRSWREVQGGDHAKYEPTYIATPVPYDITFNVGVLEDGEDSIRYDGANTSAHKVTLPYAGLINYDAEVPERFSPYYSFHGWYQDEACTIPVDFVTMPDSNTNVYGYFSVNVDEPGVTTTAIDVQKQFVREKRENSDVYDDYVIATVNVTKNFGINSLLFSPDFDATKLEFVGFLYEQDSPFFTEVDPVFPEINDTIKGGANVTDAWQFVDGEASLEDMAFLFLSSHENVFTTGKLLKLKFKIKSDTAASSKVGVIVEGRGATRYDVNGGIYYANVTVALADVNVIRVVKPTSYTALEKTYTYDPNGTAVNYIFKTKGGENYYDLTGNIFANVGDYTATATLKAVEDALVTWEDGTLAPLDFDYTVNPFVVTKPVPTGDEYTYNGTPQHFAFTEGSKVHSSYYTISGDTRTNAGSYPVTVSLNNPENVENFVWEGETTGDLGFTFTIKRVKVVMPTAYTAEDNKTYTFDPGDMVPAAYNNAGNPITYEFKAEDNASKAYYDVTNNVKTNVGNYTVTVSLKKDPATDTVINYEWDDGDDETLDVAVKNFPFNIGKYLIATPSVTSKAYNGELQTADIQLPTNSPYIVEKNDGGTELGDYDVIFKIEDDYFANYGWVAGDIDDQSVTAVFRISEDANKWILYPSVGGITYDGTPATVVSKTYDGTTVTVGASAKYGTVVIEYRLQSETDDDYYTTDEKPAPVNSGAYLARFTVAGTASYDALEVVVPFKIVKVRLNQPVAYTAEEKTYTYTGSEIHYIFKDAGNAEKYDITGNVQTDANVNGYTVTVSIKDEFKANYIWKGEGDSPDFSDDLTYTFVIGKQRIPVPVASDKQYIYNGNEQTFEFTTYELSGRYTILNNKKTAVGNYTVIARIENENKANYEWTDGTTEDKNFSFEIRNASLSATTGEETGNFTVNLSTASGFAASSVFGVTKSAPDSVATLLAFIEAATKKGALGQLTDEMAKELVKNKCFVGDLVPSLTPSVTSGEVATEIVLPGQRKGVVVLRIVGDDVEVFAVQQNENKVSFTSDGVSEYIILADHDFYPVPAPEYLVSAADCISPAVYRYSCSCGATNGETFSYGEPLGHDYDFDHIVWTWSADHLSATARITCLRAGCGHVLVKQGEEVTVTIEANIPPAVDSNGRIERKAHFTYEGDTYYSPIDVETIPAGHVFSSDPVWNRSLTASGNPVIKAVFICDCGQSIVEVDADIVLDKPTDIIYTAVAEFHGNTYRKEYDRPYAQFDFADGTHEASVLLLPGDLVPFVDETGHDREGYLFVGWRDEAGALIVKDSDGNYLDYKIGFDGVRFTAEWEKLLNVTVAVTDSDGVAIPGATVALYDTEKIELDENNEIIPKAVIITGANGEALFPSIPCGNYKMVASYPYLDGANIVRSSYIDVYENTATEEGIRVTIVLPKTKFNTIVEGIGSAEGLDGAISEEEKNQITDGTTGGTINEIVITQRRKILDVTDAEIKEQIADEVRQSEEYARGTLVDFYDITLWKTTTTRNASGEQYITQENISVAQSYQTNIFPISTEMKQEIILKGGTVDNIFVYKRHEYAENVIVIYNLPKYDPIEGEKAETECFFIKEVAGQAYIAVRQKEYSVLAFGVSPEPILILNKILTLSIDDWTYGETASYPVAHVFYGDDNDILFTYASEADGDYSRTVPTNAGTYYLKAFIEATGGYSAAEKIISFKINKKVVTRPDADETKYVYNGEPQTYRIAASDEYVVTGNVQTDAGTYTVTVALADKDNTIWDSERSEDLAYEFVIAKKKLTDIGSITFEDKSFWFNGKAHSITINGELPEGVEVTYIGNEESDLGKFTVTAVFTSSNPNYDVSDPMTAVMHIRLNWIPILILIIVALALIAAAIVIVEKLLKKEKQGQTPPPDGGTGGGDPQQPAQGAESTAEEGSNND